MAYTPTKLLSFEHFIVEYSDDTRFELADGELIDMEPTGPHEAVAGKTASRLSVEIERLNLPFLIPKTCILRPQEQEATARRPDVIVLNEPALLQEPHWQREPVILDQISGGSGQQ
jgi:Uma2 family endonuclease